MLAVSSFSSVEIVFIKLFTLLQLMQLAAKVFHYYNIFL